MSVVTARQITLAYIQIMARTRVIYGLMMAGGAIGLLASFLETIEYQLLLSNSQAPLMCNINSIFSCSAVLASWQFKIFGFPNSLLCIVFFTLMFGAGLIGLAGGIITPKLRLWLHGIALFFLAFGTWFMWQSTFVIQALCILCIFCYAGLLAINWAWLRVNAAVLPIGERGRQRLARLIYMDIDTVMWLFLAALLGLVMVAKFA